MTTSVVLACVLGAALLGAVAALVLEQRKPPSARRPPAGPAVTGREALESVDRGLRTLAAGCARTGHKPPDVYAAICSEDRLVLRLARFDTQAPAPWESDDAGEEWSVARKELTDGDPGTTATHPYSLTVTLGLHEEQRVLADLARASAPIALTGAQEDTRQLARAFVAELLTGPLTSRAEVTLVGSAATSALADSLGIRSARLHTAATLNEALSERPAGTEPDTPTTFAAAPAPAAEGVTDVFRLIEGSAWHGGEHHTPCLFVMDAAQYADERRPSAFHHADAVLLLGDAPEAAWRLAVGPDGKLETGSLGMAIDTHAGRLR
ncbi:hypothetical protein ACFQ6S_42140 [Streptomyces sp. NPDC056479]|uniref:hypothetical protein n=1 Tax=Streptomyces sp. NPDC056479 TaxID=3345832 RepID=UPI00368536B3